VLDSRVIQKQILINFLGIGIANLISLVDPQAVVVGGGLTKSWEIYSAIIFRTVNLFLKQIPFGRNKILKAKLGEKVGVIGAARVAMLSN